jgi:hypothetical protein
MEGQKGVMLGWARLLAPGKLLPKFLTGLIQKEASVGKPGMDSQKIMVEIVAKQKGCMMCDLAIAILEEIAPEFAQGLLLWEVVDVGSKEGIARQSELKTICGRMPPVPSIVINEKIAFDNIPGMEELSEAVRKATHS